MLELITSIGIFSVLCVFILEMFLGANAMQMKARDKGKAVLLSETLAETVKSASSFEDALSEIGATTKWADIKKHQDGTYEISDFHDKQCDGEVAVYVLNYDKDWNTVNKSGEYSIIIIPYEEEIQGQKIANYEMYSYCLNGYPSLLHKENHVKLFELSFSDLKKGDSV